MKKIPVSDWTFILDSQLGQVDCPVYTYICMCVVCVYIYIYMCVWEREEGIQKIKLPSW